MAYSADNAKIPQKKKEEKFLFQSKKALYTVHKNFNYYSILVQLPNYFTIYF